MSLAQDAQTLPRPKLDMVEFLREIGPWAGPLLSGIALLIGSGAASLTYLFVARRTIKTQWFDTFQALYDEFWKDEVIAEVRQWIVNDIAYEQIEPILVKRIQSRSNALEIVENEKLEKVDRFCALVTRIQFFDRYFEQWRMEPEQHVLLSAMYGRFWSRRTAQRQALREYVVEYWPGIRIGPYRRKRPFINVLRRFQLGRKAVRYFTRLRRRLRRNVRSPRHGKSRDHVNQPRAG